LYPSLEEYLELYKAAAAKQSNGQWQVDKEIALCLLEDLNEFLDMVYDLGRNK
jgi:hypothetical protein